MPSAPDKPSTAIARVLPRYWPLLFPLTYLVHLTEEYWGGFPLWSARYLGFRLTSEGFLQLNLIAWGIMFGASVLATLFTARSWLIMPFAGITFINACAHGIASIVTSSYSPGLISGLSLWLPLGTITLFRFYQKAPRHVFWIGIGVGIFLHALVIGAARGR